MKYILIVTALLLFLVLPALAQEENDSSKGENINEEAVKERLKSILKVDFSDSILPEIRPRVLLKFPSALATLSTADNSFKITLSNPENFVIPTMIFSTTIHDPYAGSPAYDILNAPRYSLNVDRVSGKYYWEW